MSITPDLVEWLIADPKVCQSWKKLGIRMNLSCYIGYIQSQEKSNSASLRMLMRLWSSAKPESYNVKNLKRVLAAEGLHHMWLWISLMTQRLSSQEIARRVQESNRRQYTRSSSSNTVTRTTTTSPWSKHLYSNQYMGETSSSGYSSDYFSDSRQDCYSSGQGGYVSCPTTPVNTRKKFDFSFPSVSETRKSSQEKFEQSKLSAGSSRNVNINRASSATRLGSDRDPPGRSSPSSLSSAPRQHVRSSSLSRLPKVEQLKSPKIVETEIWKKEIYKKVTEEIRDYGYTPIPKLTKRSGSLPNLPNYVTSVDIQVVPNRTIRFPDKQNKQSRETEKEILKLCGDIVTELKPSPLNIDLDIDTEVKINKVSIKHSRPQQNQTNSNSEGQSDKQEKFISVRNVQVTPEDAPKIKPIEIEVKHNIKKISQEPPETVTYSSQQISESISSKPLSPEPTSCRGFSFASRIEQENKANKSERFSETVKSKPVSPEPITGRGFSFASRIKQENDAKKYEIDETFSNADYDSETSSISSDAETVKSYNSGVRNVIKGTGSSFDVRKRDLGGGHFENLVNILQEAVKDIER